MSVRKLSRRKALKYGVMVALGLGAGVALGDVTGADRLVRAASPSGSDPVFSGTGIQFPSLTSDPSQLVGNMWYRSDLTAMKYSDGTAAHQLAALDLAQTFTAAQTFNGGIIFNAAGSIAGTSTYIAAAGAGGSMSLNIPSGKVFEFSVDGVGQFQIFAGGFIPNSDNSEYIANSNNRLISISSIVYNVFHASGDTYPSAQLGDEYLHLGPGGGTSLIGGTGIVLTPVSATSTSTLQNSLVEDLFGSYWNGTASVPYGFRLYSVLDSTTPTAHLSFNLNNNGTVTELLKLNQAGLWSKLATQGGGTAPATVSLTSGTAYTPSTTQNTIVTIGGGTVTAIAINGTTTGLTSGTFYLKASDTITVTFTSAPTALQMVA